MTEGAQKFISRNRAPRVQIEYDVELYGSQKKVQLPFVMGVMSDLAGKSHLEQPSIENRAFLEIDIDNFDDRMRAMQPRTAFSVPNTQTGEGHLEIDLTFEKLDDFSPQAIAEKVAPLRTLLEARNQLSHLMTYMDGKSRAETLIEKILANPSLLEVIAGNEAEDATQKEAALETLRAIASEGTGEPDQTDDVLNALKSAPAPEVSEEPTHDDILAGLSSKPLPEQEQGATSDDVLAALRSDGEGEPSADTRVADTLSALAGKVQPTIPEPDPVDQALSSLTQSETPEPSPEDSTAILKDLAAAAPDEAQVDADTDSILNDLSSIETDESAQDMSEVLDTLVADAPDEAQNDADADSILNDLSSIETEEPAQDMSEVLDSLVVDAPDEAQNDADTDSILNDLSNIEIEEPAQDMSDVLDTLAVDAPPPPAETDQIDDILGDLSSTEQEAFDSVSNDDAPATPDDEPLDDGEITEDLDAALDDLLDPASDDDPLPENTDPEPAEIDLDDLLGDFSDAYPATPPAEDQEQPAPSLEAQSDQSVPVHDADIATAADDGDIDLDALDDLLDLSDPIQPEEPSDKADAALDDLDMVVTDLAEDLDDLSATVPDGPSDAGAAHMGSSQFTFGTMSAERPQPARLERKRFRIALLGDFSGRAARGKAEIGDALANRAPVLLDPDTIEDVIRGFGITLVLPLGKDRAGVEVRLEELDDLHPDELYEKVEILYELRNLKSQLENGATAAGAAEKLKAWGDKYGTPVAAPRLHSGGNTVPANLKLTEFQKLIGDTGNQLKSASPIEDMIARIIGPYVQSAASDETAALLSAVNDALSGAMRLILHHPEFQSIEAQWRSLDLIARRIETNDQLEVMLYDVSAEEIAADLAAADDLSGSGLARMLTEAPMDPETGRGGYSAVFGLYTFEETPPHADLLGRVARVAAHIDAPFVAALSPGFMDTAKEDRHPLVASAWDALRAMPEAAYLGLVAPRFLLRRPYGAKSEPIYEFDFEEFTMSEGLGGMLWANPVVFVMILIAKSFRENGAHLGLGSIMQMGDMPFHFVTDTHGDQVALPCTERNLTLDKVEKVMARGVMPVVSIKGRDEIRLASFQSLAGGDIRGPWTGTPPPEPSPPQPVPEPATPEQPDDADDLGLDDLLAGFDDTAPDGPADDLDADLAALLEDL